ncbi:hypothetical protein GCM10027030_22980 [Luteococcus sediminum]
MIRLETVTIKSTDAPATARFWRDLLDYQVGPNHSQSVLLVGDGPTLLIQPATEAPTGDRIHFDLRTDDPAQAIAKALSLGARHADIGQLGNEGWTVMADPTGNLFCILHLSPEEAEANAGSPTAID